MAGVGQVKATPGPKMGSPPLKQCRHLQLVFTQSGASPPSLPPSAATADLFTSGAVIN